MWNPHKFSNDITPKRQTASSSYIAKNRLNCIKPPEDLRRRNRNLLASDCIPCTHSFIRASRHNMCPITTPGKVHHSITMTFQYHVIFTIPLHIPQNCHQPKKSNIQYRRGSRDNFKLPHHQRDHSFKPSKLCIGSQHQAPDSKRKSQYIITMHSWLSVSKLRNIEFL